MEYYSIGELARITNTSKKAIRYYQEEGIIQPTFFERNNYGFYTERDKKIIEQVVALKYFGLSIKDIKSVICEKEEDTLADILRKQTDVIHSQITSLQTISGMLEKICDEMDQQEDFRWEQFIRAFKILSMNTQALRQYAEESDLRTRIELHQHCSQNKQGWFKWLFNQYELLEGCTILEIGCGNGELWLQNIEKAQEKKYNITLTDISAGMLADARANLEDTLDAEFRIADLSDLPFDNDSVDIVIANHVLFYAGNLEKGLSEIVRVLKKGGKLYCSTYGSRHMKRIEELVKKYDSRIYLSNINLYEIFGLDNAESILKRFFCSVQKRVYADRLVVQDVSLLYDYIMSCHGNQKEFILGKETQFIKYLNKIKDSDGTITIEKQAGMFVCQK